MIYKTHVVKDLNYYDESLVYEDYDLLLKLSKRFKIHFSKSIDACYRLHQKNMNYNLDEPMLVDSKINILFKHLNVENSKTEKGLVLKEKILKLCETLYMQKSELIHTHIKKLRNEHNYGKIIFFCNYFRLSEILFDCKINFTK